MDVIGDFYMTDVFRYIVFPTVISILLCIPGILFDIWLSKIGASRDSKKEIIIGTFFLVFLKQFFYESLSWWIYGIALILGITLAVHRSDLGETMKHGKWWWIPKDKNKKHSNW
jgi:hypothetical protein